MWCVNTYSFYAEYTQQGSKALPPTRILKILFWFSKPKKATLNCQSVVRYGVTEVLLCSLGLLAEKKSSLSDMSTQPPVTEISTVDFNR